MSVVSTSPVTIASEYRMLKLVSPSIPQPHIPALGAKPGIPAATIPPKLILPVACVPTLKPSTSEVDGP